MSSDPPKVMLFGVYDTGEAASNVAHNKWISNLKTKQTTCYHKLHYTDCVYTFYTVMHMS